MPTKQKEGTANPSVIATSANSVIPQTKAKDDRYRNWITILYPESAVENWQNIISELAIQAIVSPLHDKDINPDGTPKKPHWHVLLMFHGKKSKDQVKEICASFGAITPQNCVDTVSQARYFIHKDNPEKYQYNANEVINFGGADWSSLVETLTDKYISKMKISDLIDEHRFTQFDEVDRYLKQNDFQLYKVFTDNVLYFYRKLRSIEDCYIKSLYGKTNDEEKTNHD